MRILLDSDCCIACLRRKPVALAWLKRHTPDDLALSAISAFELFQGGGLSQHPAQESARVQAFLRELAVVPFADNAITEAGQLSARLRRAGHSVGPYDTLIAGHALALGLTLATANTREFSRVSGLKLVDWSRG